jgi:GT2 family glycosyltransferase
MSQTRPELIVFPAAPEKTGTVPQADYATRPAVRGKFIFIGREKYWVKGVTYGTFRPNAGGEPFPPRETVGRDFAAMAARGINTVRTYTPAPRWLLDEAQNKGLRVMVGLAWEQHVAFLDDRRLCRKILNSIGESVQQCARHPALLCFAVGNEIPAGVVRWHGRCAVESFIRRLYRRIKHIDRNALVTYVNYPTTEYLQLGFLDLQCFNVYLEEADRFEAYLARLQNIAGDKPLLMAEIGLDSRRHGEERQARTLEWQIRSVFAAGCAGLFVYAWTDEWHRGGYDIEDWDFGLTTRQRAPKPALQTVARALAAVPFPPGIDWPRISVICCSHNGSATIRDTLDGLQELAYPDYEVIVVNDGSTDAVPEILRDYDFQVIHIEQGGLSHARNLGWQAASGEIVAYIDDDAWPDPHWLHYLAWTFRHTDYAGVGGPNIAPAGDGRIADCVANSPGGPVHVLLSDREAEHIPGCNMAFRREALAAIGGFDPRFRTAGDDVDICWRLQQNGGRLGFHAGAMNWHHRRNDLKTYWKQQQGYGRAEALLEEKWPEKYNAAGHFSWSGRLYGRGLTCAIHLGRSRIYGGSWGGALFQSIYQPADGLWSALPRMPEWYLITAVLALMTLLGLVWDRLLWLAPLLALGIAAPVIQAVISALRADFPTPRPSLKGRLALRALTAVLHLVQPLARLVGRLRHGLTPWRRRICGRRRLQRFYCGRLWSEEWHAPETWLRKLADRLLHEKIPASAGGDFDPWDIQVRGGLFGSARLQLVVEEHGGGHQLLRYRIRSRFSPSGLVLIALLGILGILAGLESSKAACLLLSGGCTLLALQAAREYVLSANALNRALHSSWSTDGTTSTLQQDTAGGYDIESAADAAG